MFTSMHGLMMHRPLRIIDILTFASEAYPAEGIVSAKADGHLHRQTYPQTLGRAAQLAHALIAMGIHTGDRVATLAWNGHRHFEIYYAVSGVGAVCHTINPRLSVDQLVYIINHASDRILFIEPEFSSVIQQVRDRLPKNLNIILLTDSDDISDPLSGTPDYEDLIAPYEDHFDWPEFAEETAAALCYTSGTTGDPKGALYSHRSTVLHAMMVSISQRTSFVPGQKVLPVVPLFHVNAWGLPYSAPLMGMTMVMPGPALDGVSLYRLMDREGVFSSWGVPTVWAGLMQQIKSEGRAPVGLRDLVVGGSAMPRAMITEYDDWGITVSQCWGMTETSPVGTNGVPTPDLAHVSPKDRIAAASGAGRRNFGLDFKIVDENGKRLPHDGFQKGELFVRGNTVISGYFDNTAATADAFDREKWFGTGDISSIDPIGRLTIHDRAKDLIKSGGEWISSIDLENTASGHPGIANCAVIGIAHPKWDERPVLVAVAAPGERPDLHMMKEFLSTSFARWQLPDDLIYVDSLPMTATGKISKRTLRQQFADYVLPDMRQHNT